MVRRALTVAIGLAAMASGFALLWASPAGAQEPATTGSITIVLDTSPNDAQDFAFNGCQGASCAAFTLDDDSDSVNPNTVSGSELAPGTYTITQAAVANWTLDTLTCTTGETVDLANRRVTIDLAAGADVTCTFRDITQAITIIEDASPNDVHDFTFTGCQGAGCAPFALDDDTDGSLPDHTGAVGLAPGTYVITQAADVNWSLTSISCTTSESVSVASRRVTIILTAGEQQTCTFANQAPSITIVQNSSPDDPQDFDYIGCQGAGCGAFTLDDDADGASPTSVTGQLLAAGTYTITQGVPAPAWPLSSIACTTGESVSLSNRRVTITLTKGEQTTCTFTNTLTTTPGTLTMVEDTAPDGPVDITLHRCLEATCTDIVLDDDARPDRSNTTGATSLAPGFYTVTAEAVDGYDLVSIVCNNTETVDLASRRVTVRLEANKSQICTFLHRASDQPALADIAGIDAGTVSSCARLSSGQARCWGNQSPTGELGDGTFNDSSTPQVVLAPGGTGPLTDVVDISAGFSHSCAALGSGEARCWGYGARGDGSTSASSSELPVIVSNATGTGPLTAVREVIAAGSYSCGRLDSGQVRCWGRNSAGALGDGTTVDRTRPVVVSNPEGTGPLTGATQISGRLSHTCALLQSGQARCWGSGTRGVVGDGTTANRTRPVTVLDETGSGPLTGISQVSAGFTQTCAVLDSGEARCWGANTSGQLGDGTTTDRSLPVVVRDPEGTGPLTGLVQIATGSDQTCALVDDGRVYCWGSGANGMLGDGTTTSRSLPAPVLDATGGAPFTSVTAISVGVHGSCVRLTGGEARCWGRNHSGELGDGTTMDRSVPVPVIDPSAALTPLADATQIDAGPNHSCARLDDGARCWGSNLSGQLGNPDSTITGVGVPVRNPADDGDLAGVAQITAGSAHTCARLDDGHAVCWGSNAGGRLGDGTTQDRSLPVEVSSPDGSGPLTDVVDISAGDDQTCAALDDGHAVCWGRNGSGQLGDGTLTQRLRPATVASPDGTGDLTGVVQVSAGADHTCALLSNAEVRCWGGVALGTTVTSTHRPMVVLDPSGAGPLTGAAAVAAGGEATCALLDSTEARCWGDNESGQLGDGSTTARTLPVPVVGVGGAGVLSGVASIAVGDYDACATLADGQARCWGDNILGMLGDGTRTNSSRPVVVSGVYAGSSLDGARQVAVGAMHACVALEDGQARCWGRNDNGRVGDGTIMSTAGLYARLRPRVVVEPLIP